MFETIHGYYPFVASTLLVVLVLSVWYCASVLNGIYSSNTQLLHAMLSVRQMDAAVLESIGAIKEKLSGLSGAHHESRTELHALAAHFVPRLRTELDISSDHYFEEMRSHGLDATSQFHKELKDK